MYPILQLCQRGTDVSAYIGEFEFFKAGACVFVDPLGLPMVAMLVYGAIAIPITLRTDSVMIPTVLLLITGGATMATIASPAVSIGTIVLILAGPGAITLLLYAYSR